MNRGGRCLLNRPLSRTMTAEEQYVAGNNDLNGKVAIVTGAGRNSGRALALTLGPGAASIVGSGRSNCAEADAVARNIECPRGTGLAKIGDVADATAVQAMAEAAI